jgi:hypothetical protein
MLRIWRDTVKPYLRILVVAGACLLTGLGTVKCSGVTLCVCVCVCVKCVRSRTNIYFEKVDKTFYSC